MKTTAGIEISEINQHCDCGSTCGCEKCNPMFVKSKEIKKETKSYINFTPRALNQDEKLI
jgi:hypothetical protein